MPIYEYECTKCGHTIEAWQKFSDAPLSRCDQCKGKLRKLISQSAFHLKGTGWYVTDYAKKSTSEKPAKMDSKTSEAKKSSEKSKKKAAPAES